MKKSIFIILLSVITNISTLHATNGTCGDNLTWSLEDSTLTIYGTGAMTSEPWAIRRSSIAHISLPDGLTSICSSAFYDCPITSIIIPNSVTSIGDWAFFGCTSLASVIIPNSVQHIGENAFGRCISLPIIDNIRYADTYLVEAVDRTLSSYTVKEGTKFIGSYAFGYDMNSLGDGSACTNLTNITIPNSVIEIGASAFYKSGLTSITIPNSVNTIGSHAFDNCSALVSVVIGDGVAFIDRDAFYQCSALTSVSMGNSIDSIGIGAFDKCTNIHSVHIKDLAAWCRIIYKGGYRPNSYISVSPTQAHPCKSNCQLYLNNVPLTTCTIPDGVTNICDYAFYNCANVSSVIIPNSVVNIGNEAFYYSGIKSIAFGNNVVNIGTSAFAECKGLTSIELPNSLNTIGNNAFKDCTGLTSLSIPNSVTSIGVSAFYGCKNISSLVMGSNVSIIGKDAFKGGYYSSDNKPIAVYVTDLAAWCAISFANSGANPMQGKGTFYVDSTLVKDLIIPEGVDSIGQYAFYYCQSIETITIPNSVTNISKYAFSYNSNLTTLTIGTGLETIGEYAFDNCSKLTRLNMYKIEPPLVSSNCKISPTICKLYVPATSINAYSHAPFWENFTTILPMELTVQFVDWDGTIISNVYIEQEGSAIAPTPPTREGYTFIGWDRDFSNVTEDIVVTALYQINRYKVDFVDWDGTILKSDSVDWNTAAVAPEIPARDWYTFIGWDKDFTNIIGDLIITAQYKDGQTIDYSLLFTNSTDESEITEYEISLTLPAPPEVPNFTFQKWVIIGGDLVNTIEIQAVYTAIEPTNAPEVYTNPADKAQKLIRNGQVYILTDDKTYTVTGQKVR